MELRFLGAARQVTGSCHEVVVDGHNILLDCGMFQGARQEAFEKNRALRVRGRDIHTVILSHAHIDHCGNLPQLARSGFSGTIWCTPATAELAHVMLADAASIQQRDSQHLHEHQAPAMEPLYTADDVHAVLSRFRVVPYDTTFTPAPRVTARFADAGHIIGSASVHLDINEFGRDRIRLTFTGDFGRRGVPLLRDPAPLMPAEIVITESTYGGRDHEDHGMGDPSIAMKDSLAAAVNLAHGRGGKLIIPAFAVGRTQTILYFLNELVAEGRIPGLPVFIDSPMSVAATAVMRRHVNILDEDVQRKIAQAIDPLLNSRVHLIENVNDSKRLNSQREPCVIIAPSGMCEFGRIVHHLANSLDQPRNVIAFVGYQAGHTLGRAILEGVSPVNVLGRSMRVAATIVKMNGFSAHADRTELRDALKPLARTAGHTFVVHGEVDQAEALAATLRADGFSGVSVPAEGTVVTI